MKKIEFCDELTKEELVGFVISYIGDDTDTIIVERAVDETLTGAIISCLHGNNIVSKFVVNDIEANETKYINGKEISISHTDDWRNYLTTYFGEYYTKWIIEQAAKNAVNQTANNQETLDNNQ